MKEEKCEPCPSLRERVTGWGVGVCSLLTVDKGQGSPVVVFGGDFYSPPFF